MEQEIVRLKGKGKEGDIFSESAINPLDAIIVYVLLNNFSKFLKRNVLKKKYFSVK